MEKYTKESLAKMMPEELENVVLEMQTQLEAEKLIFYLVESGIREMQKRR